MLRYFLRRFISILPVLFLVSILAFSFVRLLPGDPARIMAGEDADRQTIEMLRESMGLNKPLLVQYFTYISRVLRGDFGISLRTKLPVTKEIAQRYRPTMLLAIGGLFWSSMIGVVVGITAAVYRGKWQDYLTMTLSVSGISMPQIWLGLLLIQVFAVGLGWLPVAGFSGKFNELILPSLTLGTPVAAIVSRFTLSSFVNVLDEDYIITARAKGVKEHKVILKHTLRNALIPVVTMVGLQFGFLLGGSVIVESIFAWPGMGRFMIEAVMVRDYPVLQALLLLYSFHFVFLNLLVDMIYVWINPIIRYQ